jgi:DNA excision repair protein ERCC-2
MLDSGSVGLEAPPGFGKTLVTLVALTSRNDFPTLWRVRTHALAKHIAEQCALLNLRFFVAAGREKMCLATHEREMRYLCRYLRHKCPYYGISEVPSDDVFDYVELRERMRAAQRASCPYYAQLFVKSQVYIGVYKLGLPIPREIEVLDEAHNLIEVKSLPLSIVYDALKEIQMPKNSLARIIEHPRAFAEEMVPIVLKCIDEGKKLLAAPKLLTLLSRAEVAWVEEGEVHFIERYIPRVRAVYISATLSPFAEIFRVPIIRVPARARRAYVTTWLTTQFQEYDCIMAQRYNDLLFLLRKHFRRILAFATERVATLIHYDFDEDDLDTLEDDWSGVLLVKARGRRAEGVDLEADAVISIGAPFPPPFARTRTIGLSLETLTVITTVQNIGRALRKPSDDPFVVLADRRFLKLTQQLQSNFELVEVNDLQELDKILRQQREPNQK